MEVGTQTTQSPPPQQPDIANANSEEAADALLSGELAFFASMKGEIASRGFLFAEGKYFTCKPETSTSYSQKVVDYLSDTNFPKETKKLDVKENPHIFSFQKSNIKEKELSLHKTEHAEKQETDLSKAKERETNKTKDCFQKKMSEWKGESSSPRFISHVRSLPASMTIQQNQLTEKTQEDNKKEHTKEKPKFEKEVSEKQENKPSELEKNQEKENQSGSQDQGDKQQEQEQEEGDEVKAIAGSKGQNFVDYANEESLLSDLLKIKVSQFDVLLLFLEIMKLAIQNKELERLARRQERELQLMHLQNVVDNFKKQGNYQLFAGVGSGIFAIVSGLCPIAGHLKGDWIKDKLSYIISDLKGMETDKVFKSLTKMTFAMSELQKSTGQIQNTFAEGSRTYSQHISELHRSDGEENTRTIEEIKDHWKNIENFVYQTLQMYHEAIRQLYNI